VSSARRGRLLSSNVNIKYKVTGGAVGMPASAASAALQSSLTNTAAFATNLQAAYMAGFLPHWA
jgi:hypothetical protein